MVVRVSALSWTPSSSTSMYSGARVFANPSQSFFLIKSQPAFSFAMISASETAPVDFVPVPLFALAVLALVVTLLFPGGAVVHAAARIERDTRTRIFFMIELLSLQWSIVLGGSMSKRGCSQGVRDQVCGFRAHKCRQRGRPRPDVPVMIAVRLASKGP